MRCAATSSIFGLRASSHHCPVMRHHAHQHLRVHRHQLRVVTAGREEVAQDVLDLAGDIADQAAEGARARGRVRVADQDAEAVGVVLDVLEQDDRRRPRTSPGCAGRPGSGWPCRAAARPRGPPPPRRGLPCRRSARTPPAWTRPPAPRSPRWRCLRSRAPRTAAGRRPAAARGALFRSSACGDSSPGPNWSSAHHDAITQPSGHQTSAPGGRSWIRATCPALRSAARTAGPRPASGRRRPSPGARPRR